MEEYSLVTFVSSICLILLICIVVMYLALISIKRILKGEKGAKYEFRLVEGNKIMVDREMDNLQDEGWELAGRIDTEYGSGPYEDRMLIPLKRKIIKK